MARRCHLCRNYRRRGRRRVGAIVIALSRQLCLTGNFHILGQAAIAEAYTSVFECRHRFSRR